MEAHMGTELPNSGAAGCDTSGMIMFHRNLRKLFADAIPLVRSVAPGDTAHSAAVADHLDEMSQTLHAHHHGEDLLLWDQLEARAPACALHVAQMKAQHASMAALLGELPVVVAPFRASPDAASIERLATALESINASLTAHLGQEEADILPIVAASMPQAEFDELGKHGRASVPGPRRLISLGYILDSMTPTEAETWMRANLPAPVRLLWRIVGRRQWAAEQKSLYPEPG